MDKNSSLFIPFVSYEEEKFYRIRPRMHFGLRIDIFTATYISIFYCFRLSRWHRCIRTIRPLAECRMSECQMPEFPNARMSNAPMPNARMPNKCQNAKCPNDECQMPECQMPECHMSECQKPE
jgi:hypothetical protein